VIAQEEIFGPVLAVIKAKDLMKPLDIANNTDYGFTGGLYSRTPSHIERVQNEFAVGNLYINRSITGAIVSRHPFGGLKMSGVGSKAGGPDYLLQFLEPRHVSENVQRQGFAPIEGADQ
jgi:RHH-type proline utilization regulon transcriptional repressor/proline dehydrogenase/delta 1-pyrroline-5-carboxylate dehydrogenase